MTEGTAIVICDRGEQAKNRCNSRRKEKRDNRRWPLYREAIHNWHG